MDECAGQKGMVGPVYRMYIHVYWCTSVAVLDTCTCCERLLRKTHLVFNSRVGKVADDNDVIGKLRNDMCN